MVISELMKKCTRNLTLMIALLASSLQSMAAPGEDDSLGAFLQTRLAQEEAPAQTIRTSFDAPAERTHIMSDVVVTALGYLDRPYVYGGQNMDNGFDCSGFVLSLFQRSLGLKLPRTAADQARATKKIDHKELTPGDLVFFNTMRRKFSHVGIYVGEGRFIHSPRAGASIRIESMNSTYWKKRFNGAHRVAVRSSTTS